MKKFLLTSVLLLAIPFYSSQAGIGLLYYVLTSPEDSDTLAVMGFAGIVAAPAGLGTGITGLIVKSTTASIIGAALLVLDGETDNNATSRLLSNEFSFIDDPSAINEISQMVNEKFQVQSAQGLKNKYASLSEIELAPVLSRLDLTNEQRDLVIEKLK